MADFDSAYSGSQVEGAITAVRTTKRFANTVVDNAAFVADTTYPTFPFRASVALSGVVATMVPYVVFGVTEVASGLYAPVAACYNGGVYLYASAAPAADITIPTIICWPEVV